MKRNSLRLLGVAGLLALAGLAGAATYSDPDIAAKAAHEIRMYSRYSIWDNVNLRVNGGTTYMGDNSRARRELGYSPRPLRKGVAETLKYEMERMKSDTPQGVPT